MNMFPMTAIHLGSFALALIISSNPFAQSPQFNYIKKATRAETRAATMAQYAPQLEWKPWHIIGPFDNPDRAGHDIVYPPELGVDLTATYEGRGGETVQFKSADFTEWDPINLKQFGDEN